MIKVYIANSSKTAIGGGWTFIRNLKKGLRNKVEFVDNFKECDIFFIFGVTAVDKNEFHEAHRLNKKIILRCDNIPRKSRNKRQSPTDRLTEFGNKASIVIYQSNWCKEYAGYFIDNKNEYIINNGVDTEIFNKNNRNSNGNTYLYINYNDNPNKRFDEALYWFDMEWRKNKEIKLYIAGQVPKIYIEHPEYNWDLTGDGKVEYKGIMNSPEEVSNLMKQCDILLYPSFAEAYPNTLLEAMACGIKPLYINNIGGSIEVYHNASKKFEEKDGMYNIIEYKVKSIEQMSSEYLEVFENICSK